MPSRPTTDEEKRRNHFSALVETMMRESGKSNIQLADDMGYSNQNIISMFKSGKTRVPVEKVASLAKTCGYDPAWLLREWFMAFMPDLLPDLEEHFGVSLSAQEKSWINNLRKLFERVPPFDTRLGNNLKHEYAALSR